MRNLSMLLSLAVIALAAALSAQEATVPVTDALDGAISIKSQEAAPSVPREPVALQVPWRPATSAAVELAGPQFVTWDAGQYGGAADLSARLSTSRDAEFLWVQVDVTDDLAPAPERLELAFTTHDAALITQWRDVGMRYQADDVHFLFTIAPGQPVGAHWAHLPRRWDRREANDSFGSETERRALLDQGAQARPDLVGKVFAQISDLPDGGSQGYRFEAAIPWTALPFYDPTSLAPLGFNLALRDQDETPQGTRRGALAWRPGLVGTYSGYHFAALTFAPPPARTVLYPFARTDAFHFLGKTVPVTVGLYNPGPAAMAHLRLEADGSPAVLAEADVEWATGSNTTELSVASERIPAGRRALRVVLTPAEGPSVVIPVAVPTADGQVTIQPLSEVRTEIQRLEHRSWELRRLVSQIEAAGLDVTYPRAWLTLEEMFVSRCRDDLQAGDGERVLRNTAFLEAMHPQAIAYCERVLSDPGQQLTVPAKVAPDTLRLQRGYWTGEDGRPRFLWGPCTFWYLRGHQPWVIGLGSNSVCPELDANATPEEIAEHMAAWYDNGILVNAALRVPELQLTGADAQRSPLLAEHPELANLDQNNFLPFLLQHPVAREAIRNGFADSVDTWSKFPGVRSYWLWNEPYYTNFSETHRQDFIETYLKPNYKTIDALNQRWRSTYDDFGQIELIKWPDPENYAPWYDFQVFHNGVQTDFWQFLNDTSKSLDSSRPTHTKFMMASLHAGNMEAWQRSYDIAGHDGGVSDRDVLFLDYMKSLWPERALINTEFHIWYGNHKSVEIVPWRFALHGGADGNWWCWHSNANFSDSVGNAASMHALTFGGLDLQRLFDPYMVALNRQPSSVATLFADVIERRSDVKMVRLRHEIAPAQYALGLKPHYVAESRIGPAALRGQRLLIATDADYVRDGTYDSVLAWVRGGGTVLVAPGTLAHNEYGDPRDTSELVQATGGEAYGEGARRYPVGRGWAVCIDDLPCLPDVVTDGGEGLRVVPLPEHLERRALLMRVLDRALGDLRLRGPVRLEGSEAGGLAALTGLDWRAAPVRGGYTLCAVPYGADGPFAVQLATDRPIRRLVNLVSAEDVDPAAWALPDEPSLWYVELGG